MSDTFENAIAVIGCGCVLPDAFRVEPFWNNTLAGHCALRELGGPRWDWRRYHDPSGKDQDRAITIVGAAVEGWALDWKRFRIPPADLATINPLALMTLDAGAQALDAVVRLPAARAGVFVGATGFGWQRDAGLRIRMDELLGAIDGALADMPEEARAATVRDVRARLDARLGPVTEDTIVNGPASVAAGRLAMRYDLRGIHYAIDAGFASSLASLEAGVRALRDGTVDLALVGGASELLAPLELVAFSRLGGLSPSVLRPFDADADGTLLGEGAAMFALKRLDDALRDEEHIHAVIRGVAGASDGRARSLVAPHPDGQALAMTRAYADAALDPDTIAYVECHATGTPVGDRSELEALSQVIGARDGVFVGSAKSAVGHLRGGAGAVGLLRAMLALEHGVVPQQVGFTRASDALRASGFTVPERNQPLTPRRGSPVVRAAVSAFGFGGIDYHAVLEAFDPRVHRRASRVTGGIPRVEPVAIVGMGGLFPKADDVPALWRGLLEGVDATREVPADRWPLDDYYDPDPTRNDTSYTRLGCFLDRLPAPDPRWRIPPASLPLVDPSHLLALAAADEALADAGIDPERWDARERVAVMLAFLPYQGRKFLADIRVSFREVLTELERALAAKGVDPASIDARCRDAERLFKEALPPITEDSLTGWLGSLNAGRISRLFDLHGTHFVVDAACASTHAAMHAAVTALRHRTADVALTGGVWCDMQPEFFVGACRFNALSATGSTPFDVRADGFIPGEGGGVFVLRRLEDAERDGQRVHAIIRAVSGASDGKGRSVLAPTVEGEAAAMELALEQAGLEGADVGYVECHGTGTALGDVVEAEAIGRAFGSGRDENVRIGSVKSNIGHLNAAAGVPGVIKAALAVREGVIPPSLKVNEPNPAIDFAGGKMEVVRTLSRWERPASGARRAGVSSFGVGGANMHIILEEHRMTEVARGASRARHAEEVDAAMPIAMAAGVDPAACLSGLEALAQRFGLEGPDALGEPIGIGPWRAAVVAPDPDELGRRLGLLRAALARDNGFAFLRPQGIFVAQPGAPVVVTFPGQGPHYANMARELARSVPVIEETLAEADEVYRTIEGRPLRSSFWTDAPDAWSQRDEDIHCAVFAVNVALYRMVVAQGLEPMALIGQSAGELSALTAAGALSFADGLRAVHRRTRAVLEIQTDDPGAMVSIRAGAAHVTPLLDGLPGYAALAADNGPSASIVSANRAALEPLRARLRERGHEHSVLAVSHGYHSALIADAIPSYRAFLHGLRFGAPRVPIYSTITGRALSEVPPNALADHLASQFVEPVRLQDAVDLAWRDGGRLFVECGPKWSLTSFTEGILQGREHVAQATLHPKIGEREQAARALACLAVHGHGQRWPERRVSSPRGEVREVERLRAVAAHIAGRERSSEASAETLRELLGAIRDAIDVVLDDRPEREAVPARVAGGAEAWTPPVTAPRPPEAPSRMPTPLKESGEHPIVAGSRRADIAERLIAAFAERTGYPEEMLEPDLDLEADLGIDTVKQVAVLGSLREELGLALDPSFVLRDHGTIGAMAAHFASQLRGGARQPEHAAESAPVQAPEPADERAAGSARDERAVDSTSDERATGSARDERDVLEQLRDAFATRTGYPAEMLEPELDLEAELGIDTVKQVAVLGELRAALGLPPDPSFELRRHPTLGALARYLASRVASASPGASSPGQTTPSRPASRPPAGQPRRTSIPPGGDVRSDVRARLVEAFARRTGYPEEMLEPDLDLEAELGIDTVKQVAVLTSVREALGLEVDPAFQLRAHPTLRHIVDYLATRLGGAPRSRPPARRHKSAPPSTERERDIAALLRRAFAERTGYPDEMLEPDLELEADLGIDTVKQAAVLAQLRESLDLPPDPEFVLRDHRTLAAFEAYFRARLGDAPLPAPAPRSRPPTSPASTRATFTYTARSEGTAPSPHHSDARLVTDARLIALALRALAPAQLADGGTVAPGAPLIAGPLQLDAPALVPEDGQLELLVEGRAGQACVRSEGGIHAELGATLEREPRSAALPPELFRAFMQRRGATNSDGLARDLGRPVFLGAGWAHAPRFDIVIGAAEARDGEPSERAALLFDAALWHAALLWAQLLGTSHIVRSVRALSLEVLPEPGSEVRFVAELAPRANGRAHANVVLYDCRGRPLGAVHGIEGVAVGAPALDLERGGPELARWQHLVQRLAGPLLDGEDTGW